MDAICILLKIGNIYQAIDVQGRLLASSNERDFVLKNIIDTIHIIFVDSSFKED